MGNFILPNHGQWQCEPLLPSKYITIIFYKRRDLKMKGVISVQELNILAFRKSYYMVILDFLLNLGTLSLWTSQSKYQVWEIPLLRIRGFQ